MPVLTWSSLFLVPELHLIDTIGSLQDSHGGVIPLQEVLGITKIHDILDSAVSQLVVNTAHILAISF